MGDKGTRLLSRRQAFFARVAFWFLLRALPSGNDNLVAASMELATALHEREVVADAG